MCYFLTPQALFWARRRGCSTAVFPLDGDSASRTHLRHGYFAFVYSGARKIRGHASACYCSSRVLTLQNISAVDLIVKLQCSTQHLPGERSPKCPRCAVASSSSAFIINERDSVCSALCTDSLDSASSIPVLCYFNVQDSLLCT